MTMTTPSTTGSMQTSGALAGALQHLLSQLIDGVMGSQTVGKDGKPLREVCYMHMPMGKPIDPRDHSFPWTPAGGASIADYSDAGIQNPPKSATTTATSSGGTPPASGTPAPAKAPPTSDPQLLHGLQSAANTAMLVDRMLRVTSDGMYRPFEGGETVSSAYNVVVRKAQGIPAPPPPADIQAKIDAARKVLWILDANGNVKGKTDNYKQYQKLSQAWASARAAFAAGYATTQTDPAMAAAWPVTSSSLQMTVDNAWDDWRSAGADEIENALDTLGSVGGSVGAYFVSQARQAYDAWDLGLSGIVPANTPYSEVMPGSWYDPNDTENGFTQLTASDSQWQSAASSYTGSMASGWYQGHSQSTSAGAAGMVFGITFGVSGGSGSSSDQSGSSASGQSSYSFSDQTSNVSIDFSYGLCDIYRPWLLNELFVIDGWYLPGEKANAVSDGTVAGQKDASDKHFFSMLPTQFLVIRNVKITADGWGEVGNQLSSYAQNSQSSDQSSSSSVSGGVGFLGIGGVASHDSADWSGQDSQSASAAGSWFFEGGAQHGTLTIHGCQIVGWVGEINPASPKIDDPTLAHS